MEGYHKLTAFMARCPDALIFKRFGHANILNLLFLQAEIINKEFELGEIIKTRDASTQADGRFDLNDCLNILQNKDHGTTDEWQLVLEIRSLLETYNDALLKYRQLQSLPPPPPVDLKGLQDWLTDREGGLDPKTGLMFLKSFENRAWEYTEDLVSLTADQSQQDALTNWIHNGIIPWLHRRLGRRWTKKRVQLYNPAFRLAPVDTPTFVVPNDEVERVISVFSTVLASLLPIMSIYVLFFITRPLTRIAAITLFTFAFSLLLALVTRARRAECFGITSAFVAVLVVFLGNNPNDKQSA